MQTMTLKIKDETMVSRIYWLLKHFEEDGVEISLQKSDETQKALKELENKDGETFESVDALFADLDA